GGLAEGAGAVVEQVLERLGVLGAEEGLGRVGPRGLLLQAAQAFAGEGVDGIAYGGRGTAELASDAGGPLATAAGQEDLTPAGGEGVAGAQALPQPLLLLGGPRRNKEWRAHTPPIRGQGPTAKTSFAFTLVRTNAGPGAGRISPAASSSKSRPCCPSRPGGLRSPGCRPGVRPCWKKREGGGINPPELSAE